MSNFKLILNNELLIINLLIVSFFLIPFVGDFLPFILIFFVYSIRNYKLNYSVIFYAFFLIAFSFIIFLIDVINNSGIEVIGRFIYPILFFLLGFVFYRKYGEKYSANLKLKSALALLLFCFFSVIYTQIKYGEYSDFTIENGRVVYEYLTDVKYSNTLINGYLSLSMVLLPIYLLRDNDLAKNKNIQIFIMSIVSVYLGVMLGNRSTFIIFICVLFTLLFIKKINWFKLIFLSAILLIYYFTSYNNSIMGKRMESDEGLDNSRLRNWGEGLEIIKNNPLVGSSIKTKDVFAHNFLLDIAIPYGVIPALILMILFIMGFMIFFKFLFLKNKSFFVLYFIVIFVGINVIFLIEPAYQGLFKLFCFYCLMIGMGFSYFSETKKEHIKC